MFQEIAMCSSNGEGEQKNEAKIINSVIIFRTFDLAEFFKEKNELDIHFLDNRANREFQKLFLYQTNKASNKACLQDLFPNDATGAFYFSGDDQKLDEKAYRTGMVRSNLYDLCIFPKYVCNKDHVDNLIHILFNNSFHEDSFEKEICDILTKRDESRYQYKKEKGELKSKLKKYKIKLFGWINSSENLPLLDNLVIKLSISQYGIISVFLELKLNNMPEPRYITSLSDKFEKSKEKLKKLYYLDDSKNEPSLITFISIITILDFLYAIREKNNNNYYYPNLDNWFKNVSDIICFDKLWQKCTSNNRLPLRHNLSHFYFQNNLYDKSLLTENTDFRKKLIDLALFTSYQYSNDNILDADVENYKKNELCVTTNGTARMIDTTLIVAARHADYCIGGQNISEEDYWKGVFRLICFLREYLLLCDRCLRDLRTLRDHYSRAQKTDNLIRNDLSQLSSLLFDMDEGINRILASRILFTHGKLKTICLNSGLLDLMENVTRRRRHLESRINEASIQRGQEVAISISKRAIIITTVVAIITMFVAIKLAFDDTKTETKEFDSLMNAINGSEQDPDSPDKKNPEEKPSITSLLKQISCKLNSESTTDNCDQNQERENE